MTCISKIPKSRGTAPSSSSREGERPETSSSSGLVGSRNGKPLTDSLDRCGLARLAAEVVVNHPGELRSRDESFVVDGRSRVLPASHADRDHIPALRAFDISGVAADLALKSFGVG